MGKCEVCLKKTKCFIETPYGKMHLCRDHKTIEKKENFYGRATHSKDWKISKDRFDWLIFDRVGKNSVTLLTKFSAIEDFTRNRIVYNISKALRYMPSPKEILDEGFKGYSVMYHAGTSMFKITESYDLVEHKLIDSYAHALEIKSLLNNSDELLEVIEMMRKVGD